MTVLEGKNLRRLLACGFLTAILLAAYPLSIKKDMSDFGVCYKAGQRILAGETLYRASDGHLQYKYAPAAADLYALFSFMPWEIAKILWYLLSLLILAGVAALSYKVIPRPKKKAAVLVGLTILIMSKYFGRELQLGQVNILIVFLLTAAASLFLAKKDLWAGVIWGVSLFLKPYALVFLPYFALKRRWKALAGGAATVLVGFLIPVMNYGFQGNTIVLKEWFSSLSQSTPRLLAVGDNASLFAVVLKATRGQLTLGAMAALALGAGLIGLALLIMMFRKKTNDTGEREVCELAYLMVLIPLFSPLGWNYNYIYGFLAVMILLNALRRFSWGLRAVAVANFVLIGGTLREILGKDLFRFYTRNSFIAWSFLLVLALLVLLQLKPWRSSDA